MLQHDHTTCMAWDPELCWLPVTVLARFCSSAASIIHAYICIPARQGLLYPMHAVLCWSSPGYKLLRLGGGMQLWSWNHCNYVTLLLPPDCLAKPRSHLQGGMGDILLPYRRYASGGSAGFHPASPRLGQGSGAPVSGCPAASAAPPSFALQHGHCLACQPQLRTFPPLLAAHLCQGWGSQGRAGPQVELGAFLPCWAVHFPHQPMFQLLFQVTCPRDGPLNWILEIMKVAKGMDIHGGNLRAT